MHYPFILFFIFLADVCFAQSPVKVKILDAENRASLSGARIITAGQVLYSNEDGEVLLPGKSAVFEVFAPGYETEKTKEFSSEILLKPLYRDIDEVKIISVDIGKLLNGAAKNYSEIYYDKPAVYDVTYWQKSFENNSMKQLMVADGQFWARDGQFNAKEAFNKKYNNFVQLQIDHLRYLKTEPYQSKIKVRKQDASHDYIGDLFFSYELFKVSGWTKLKKAKVSGRLIYEKGDEQVISYTIRTDENLEYTGLINYDKKDKAITHFEMDFNQEIYAPYQMKDENGNRYQHQLGNGSLSFDFYKKGDRYVPSRVAFKSEGFKYITDSDTYEFRSERQLVFKNMKESDAKGLEKPVEIYKAFWNDMKVDEDKGGILLSKEEQEFINGQ